MDQNELTAGVESARVDLAAPEACRGMVTVRALKRRAWTRGFEEVKCRAHRHRRSGDDLRLWAVRAH
jgi:hypothetical protein